MIGKRHEKTINESRKKNEPFQQLHYLTYSCGSENFKFHEETILKSIMKMIDYWDPQLNFKIQISRKISEKYSICRTLKYWERLIDSKIDISIDKR